MRFGISNGHSITTHLHCKLCLEELAISDIEMTPAQYQLVEVGYTEIGIQIWCQRHQCNIMHMDFDGQKHHANLTRKASTNETISNKEEA